MKLHKYEIDVTVAAKRTMVVLGKDAEDAKRRCGEGLQLRVGKPTAEGILLYHAIREVPR